MIRRKPRVGLIGLGDVGVIHLKACLSVATIDLVAVAELDPARRSIANEDRISVYADHRRMLADEDLDIACVLAPAASHLKIVRDCAKAGVAIFCEKPLSISVDDGEALIGACRDAGVPLFYGSSYRFLPAIRAARDLIAQGAIGKVRFIRESYLSGNGPDKQHCYGTAHYPVGLPGGSPMGLVDHGIHLLDIMPWLVDSPVVAASGRGNISGDRTGVEWAILELQNGTVCSLTYDDGTWPTELPGEGIFGMGSGWDRTGFVPAGRWQNEPGCIHVHGTAGALRIFHYANALFQIDATGVTQVRLEDDPAPAHFARQIENFAESVRLGTSPSVDGSAGLEALRVLHLIYKND